MHASTEQLLSLRDREPVGQAVAAHVGHCAECSAELERLRGTAAALRALPALQPPAGAWQRIETGLDRPRRPWRFALAASAALVLAAAIVAGLAMRPTMAPDRAGRAVADAATIAAERADTLRVASAREDEAFDAMLVESRRLEQVLRELDARAPRVMSAHTAGAIAGLQDGIAVIDYGLSHGELGDGAESRELWSRRIALMNTLVQVRGAQLQPVSN